MTNYTMIRLSLPIAVIGFMLIIATGFNMLIGKNDIPLIIAVIGLILVGVAMIIRKKGVSE